MNCSYSHIVSGVSKVCFRVLLRKSLDNVLLVYIAVQMYGIGNKGGTNYGMPFVCLLGRTSGIVGVLVQRLFEVG